MPASKLLLTPPLKATTGNRLYWTGLQGAARALAIAEGAQQHNGLSLVITPDTASADSLEQELHFFAPQLPVVSFPDWETLPYDRFSPHQDIISQRLRTLFQLFGAQPSVSRALDASPISRSTSAGR